MIMNDIIMGKSPFDASVEQEFTEYNDQRIRKDGEFINLTDMWKALGRPESKAPCFWKRLTSVIEFKERLHRHLSRQLGTGFSRIYGPLIRTEMGQRRNGDDNGSTWAHWQLAMVYAHYLDQDFYIWCNQVARDQLQLPSSASYLPEPPLTEVWRCAFKSMEVRQEQILQLGRAVLVLTTAIQRNQTFGKRNAFTDFSKRLICDVVAEEPYGGNCPCCSRHPVLTENRTPVEGAEFDHFYAADLNKPEFGWLICKDCHDMFTLGSPLIREAYLGIFQAFSFRVADWKAAMRPKSYKRSQQLK